MKDILQATGIAIATTFACLGLMSVISAAIGAEYKGPPVNGGPGHTQGAGSR